MAVLPACMPMPQTHTSVPCKWMQENPLGLESQTGASHHMGVEHAWLWNTHPLEDPQMH